MGTGDLCWVPRAEVRHGRARQNSEPFSETINELLQIFVFSKSELHASTDQSSVQGKLLNQRITT